MWSDRGWLKLHYERASSSMIISFLIMNTLTSINCNYITIWHWYTKQIVYSSYAWSDCMCTTMFILIGFHLYHKLDSVTQVWSYITIYVTLVPRFGWKNAIYITLLLIFYHTNDIHVTLLLETYHQYTIYLTMLPILDMKYAMNVTMLHIFDHKYTI